ncbi:MAG: hypothetical protein FJ225_08935 [Lentisphaerae bacterium]|nr:hypothetical protein [Lentisphaerota bacterium]
MVATAVTVLLVMGLAAVGAEQKGAQTGCEKGGRVLLLSGGGLSMGDGSKLAADVEAAHFWADNLSVGLRQSLDYEDFRPGVELLGSTAAVLGWYLPVEVAIPFAAASAGVSYSNLRGSKPFVSPELGIRKFLAGAAFANASAQYLMYYDAKAASPEPKWRGRVEYNLGIGVLF